MSAIASEWRATIADADDNAIVPLCDWLVESGEVQNEELAAILLEWVNVKTMIRTFHSVEEFKACTDTTEFEKKLFDWNLRYFPDIEPRLIPKSSRDCFMSGRIGDLYTHLSIQPSYFVKCPNLLSGQPIRSMFLMNGRAERKELFDLFSNWRLEKLWYLDVSYFTWWGQRESNLVDVIRMMKPMKSLKRIMFRGVKNTNYQISASLIGSKKLSKGCEIIVGGKTYKA